MTEFQDNTGKNAIEGAVVAKCGGAQSIRVAREHRGSECTQFRDCDVARRMTMLRFFRK
jgi:hypothetical protein